MLAIALELKISEVQNHHPKGVSQGYTDIVAIVANYGFYHVSPGFYVTENEDLANLFRAILALKSLGWIVKSVKNIYTFRIAQWSDFTAVLSGYKE